MIETLKLKEAENTRMHQKQQMEVSQATNARNEKLESELDKLRKEMMIKVMSAKIKRMHQKQ